MRNVRVLKTLDFPPFICFKCRCGNDTRDFYIDLGIDSEYDGAIFLCNLCMLDIATQTGLFITVDKHNEALVEQTYLVESYHKLLLKMEIWGNDFKALTGFNLHDYFDILEKVKNGPRQDSGDSGEPDSQPTNTNEFTESDYIGTTKSHSIPLNIHFS